MLLENLFPPIPSELVMPFAGFLVAENRLNLPLTILASTLGSMRSHSPPGKPAATRPART